MPEARATGADATFVLAFDTAGSACSVAVGRDDTVIAHECRPMRHGHAEALLPMIDRVMEAAGLAPTDISIIAVTVGPGGFTGIRAGLAAAHGLALASGARLLGISSFAAVAASLPITGAQILIILDSRRTDFYAQLFDVTGNPVTEPNAIAPEHLAAWLGDRKIIVAGDATEPVAVALAGRPRTKIVPGTAPGALGLLAALQRWPGRADPRARPLYLRPPDVSFPKTRAGMAGGRA
jgi:tRNA threonylcarbamoyladenosine biosynthesis protein TsaB